MLLYHWILVLAYILPTLIYGYIAWRWERNLIPLLFLPAGLVIFYGWIGITTPPVEVIQFVFRYLLLFFASFYNYIAIERLIERRGKKNGV